MFDVIFFSFSFSGGKQVLEIKERIMKKDDDYSCSVTGRKRNNETKRLGEEGEEEEDDDNVPAGLGRWH